MDWRAGSYILVLTGLLGGCAGGNGGPETLFEVAENPAPLSVPAAATAHSPITPLAGGVAAAEPGPGCPPLAPGLRAEAARYTPMDADWQRSLILSEIAKNRAIAEAVAAYERCRKVSGR